MLTRLDVLKSACAYITAGGMRGTGYLVAPDVVVTCAHVVSQISKGERLQVSFGNLNQEAEVLAYDNETDCALLRLATPVEEIQPLRLTVYDCKRDDQWDAYGFPTITKAAGHFLKGEVQDPEGNDPSGSSAVVLFSREIAAAEGAPPQGFSGSPVLIGGYVIGHLKRIIPNDSFDNAPPRAMLGTLYACPARSVADFLSKYNANPAQKNQSPEIITMSEATSHKTLTTPKRIFISYKRDVPPDEAVAGTIFRALRDEHDVFIDRRMLIGTQWVRMIEKEIQDSDFFIVLLSPESVRSEMVITEVEIARSSFKERGYPKILPVRLAFRDRLDYRLGSYLNDINWAFWEGESDTGRIIYELRQALSGEELKLPDGVFPILEGSEGEGNALPPPSPSARPVPLEQPGGTMDPDSAFYVERKADEVAIAEIAKQGVTITIKGPRQVGKSSLLEKTVASALDLKKQIVFLDFQQFDGAALRNADTFYPQFRHWAWRESGSAAKPTEYADQNLGHVQRTSYFMQELVTSLTSPMVLAMDEVERLFTSEFRSDFFGMLRSWHNGRRRNSSWQRLDIVLVTSTEPYLFIDNDKQSPFNVGEVIELGDFNPEDVTDLNRRHGSPLSSVEETKLIGLIGAHPYLVRKALFLVASGRTPFGELFAAATEDYGPFGDHLRTLLFHLHDKPELIDGIRQVIRQRQCPDDRIFHRLRGAGLVRREGNEVVPRCALYAEFFKRRLNG